MLSLFATLPLIACTQAPPTLSMVDPKAGEPGERIKVVGADFQEGATATMGGQDLAVKRLGATLLEGTVPLLEAGDHTVIVANPDGQNASSPGAFTIAAPPQALSICAQGYTSYTQLAAGRSIIKIDIHRPDTEEIEQLEIKFRDVEGVEYRAEVQGEALCSAILLTLKDGRRIVYEDSKELNFKKKAQELAQIVGVGIEVTVDEALLAEE